MTQAIRNVLTKPGTVLSIALGLIVMGALVAISALALPRATAAAAPTTTQLGVMLYRVGLDPEALAAAGVQPAQIASLVTEAETVLTTQLSALTLAETDLAEANRQVTALEPAIRAGVADESAVNSLAIARSNATNAQARVQAIQDEVFAAATQHLSADTMTTLQTIAANRRWGLPIQYTLRNRTEAQWKELRKALANVRISAQVGEDPDNTCSTLVATEDSRPEVSQAAVYLNTRLAAINTTYETELDN